MATVHLKPPHAGLVTTRELLVQALNDFDLGRTARARLTLEKVLHEMEVGADLTVGVAMGYMDPGQGVKWRHKGHFDARRNRRVAA